LAEPSGNIAGVTTWVNDDTTALSYEEKVALIDRNVANILEGIVKTHTFKGDYVEMTYADVQALSAEFAAKTSDVYVESAAVNRATAAEAMVLLKNNDNMLPLPASKSVAIVNSSVFEGGGMNLGGSGVSYGDFIVEGGGSAQVTFDANYTVDFKKGFENAGYTVVDDIVTPGTAITAAKAAELAAAADYGVYVISRPSSEGADNTQASFDMYDYETASYNALITAFHAVDKDVIVLINAGASINVQAFKANADAILVTWLPGTEGGNALLDILTGAVNPSGKHAQTFPLEYNDSPSIALAKAEHEGNTWSSDPEYYDEGVYVGYRYFSTFDKEDRVAYPFGYGLSYTTFEFSDLELSKKAFSPDNPNDVVTASVTVTNTGSIAGMEVVQLYLSADSWEEEGRPKQELRAYGKTGLLQPGESETITLEIKLRDLQYYDDGNPDNVLDDLDTLNEYTDGQQWVVEVGTVFTATINTNGENAANPNSPLTGLSDTFVYGDAPTDPTDPTEPTPTTPAISLPSGNTTPPKAPTVTSSSSSGSSSSAEPTATPVPAAKPTPLQVAPLLIASAIASTDTLEINGVAHELPSAKIADYNWIKLRDLAYLLNNTSKQFSLGWDDATKTITITTRSAYASVGDELGTILTGSIPTNASMHRILLDGVEIKLAAYNINGYNYFRLRDLAIVLDFALTYRETDAAAVIDLTKGY
jgi:hypothetical protein